MLTAGEHLQAFLHFLFGRLTTCTSAVPLVIREQIMKRRQFLQTAGLGLVASAATLLFMAHAALTPARAIEGTLGETTVPTTNVPSPAPRRGENTVPITYYLPKNYDANRAKRYPLLIQLHGGGGSNKDMEDFRALSVDGGMGGLLDLAIKNGLVAPLVSVMPYAGRAFYMNFRDGSQKWEDFVMKDLLPYMRKNFNVAQEREGTFIAGISMGGTGALLMAIKYPEVFQAVASLEPAIEPALAYDDITLRDRIGRPDGNPDSFRDRILLKQMYGDPIDKDYWAANHPTAIIKKDPSRLLGLGIYLEVGDQDLFFIDHGTEFVHRVLFDAGISHEYRLVKGADHVGPSLIPRTLDAFAFIGRQLTPPKWIDDTVLRFRAGADQNKKARGFPVKPFDPNRIHAE
jgi:S-formylglutathione hydrolase